LGIWGRGRCVGLFGICGAGSRRVGAMGEYFSSKKKIFCPTPLPRSTLSLSLQALTLIPLAPTPENLPSQPRISSYLMRAFATVSRDHVSRGTTRTLRVQPRSQPSQGRLGTKLAPYWLSKLTNSLSISTYFPSFLISSHLCPVSTCVAWLSVED